jgi:hypothetical protein
MDLVIFPELVLNFYYEGLLQNSPQEGKFLIPGKRCATRNPVPPKAGFKQFWIPAPRLKPAGTGFAGMMEPRI